jgi:2-dehydropantoate 2-reductase
LRKIEAMKIIIVGAGAMGCLFGGLLAEAGREVRLLDIHPDQARIINERGVRIVRHGVERTVRVDCFVEPEQAGQADLVLLFVKHGHTLEAARSARRLIGRRGHVLTLQNGMGNGEIIAPVIGPDRLLCGTTAQGAMVLGPGRVQHSGAGPTVIGPWQGGDTTVAEQAALLLDSSGIAATAVADIRPVLWAKLFANVGINAITALAGIRNGELLDLEETRALVAEAVDEAVAVAQALQVEVAEDVTACVFDIARATASNRSSMGQDVDAARQTEIGAINGYIVDRAEELGIEVPVNRTLARLIRTRQAHY